MSRLTTIGLTLAILATLMTSSAGRIENWGVDYPIVLHMQNSSVVYLSNVDSTQGWNITLADGSVAPVEVKKLNATWAVALNLTTGKVTPILPIEWFTLNESYYFKDDGKPMTAFKITDAKGVTVLDAQFNVAGIVTGQENEPINQSYAIVSNGSMSLYGHWIIYQQNSGGTFIPAEVNVTGEYLVCGEPTGFASEGSSRTLEKETLRKELRAIQARLEKI